MGMNDYFSAQQLANVFRHRRLVHLMSHELKIDSAVAIKNSVVIVKMPSHIVIEHSKHFDHLFFTAKQVSHHNLQLGKSQKKIFINNWIRIRIGNSTGILGVSLTPGAIVNRRVDGDST